MNYNFAVQLKYSNSAISEDSPSYFKCNYVEVRKSPLHNAGKKIFPLQGMKSIFSMIKEPKSHSQVRLHAPLLDQDLDSMKLSIQPDITRGYKNTVRYQSNHYRAFYAKVESSGFKRLGTEITSLQKMPKITRTLKGDLKPKCRTPTKKKEISKKEFKKNSSYLLEMSKPKLPKILSESVSEDEIEKFEKKLKETTFEKKKNVYEGYDTGKKNLRRLIE